MDYSVKDSRDPPMGLPYGMVWTHTIPISLGIRKWSLKIPLILVLVIGGLGTITPKRRQYILGIKRLLPIG